MDSRSNRLVIAGVSLAALVAVIGGCAGPAGSMGPIGQNVCEVPGDLDRSGAVPIGVLLPSGSFDFQSYSSAEEIVEAGLTAVSLGWAILYDSEGNIVYDRNGGAGEQSKKRWLDQARCAVLEAKRAGLVVSLWGQFQQASVNGEPGAIPEPIRQTVLSRASETIADMARLAEDLQVEYFSPVSELDKYAGREGHNDFFAEYITVTREYFSGTVYVQPFSMRPQAETLDLGGADALAISWISYECFPDDVRTADRFIEQARNQGIDKVFIGEIGDVMQAEPTDCLFDLIARWGGDSSGVFVLDSPPMMPNAAEINGSWQEGVLRSIVSDEG